MALQYSKFQGIFIGVRCLAAFFAAPELLGIMMFFSSPQDVLKLGVAAGLLIGAGISDRMLKTVTVRIFFAIFITGALLQNGFFILDHIEAVKNQMPGAILVGPDDFDTFIFLRSLTAAILIVLISRLFVVRSNRHDKRATQQSTQAGTH